MRAELQNSLYREFPDLYWRHTSTESCMKYGISIHDGWYPALHDLSIELQAIIIGSGLNPRLYCFEQVKEKLGYLRIYFCQATDEMRQAVARVVMATSVICEDCGDKGELRKGSYWHVKCDGCQDIYASRYRRRQDSGVQCE